LRKGRKKLKLQDKNFAAVDIGTNSFHLIIVKIKEDGSLVIIDREREVIRLGSHKGEGLSLISSDEIEHGVNTLIRFKKLADLYQADIRAVATSAVREADNRQEFLDRVFSETKIEIEVIDGRKEAEYIYRGIRKSLPYENKKLLCLDIGGGSTEFILGYNDEILFGESIKIGAIRLSKKFFPDFILTEDGIDKCKEYIEQQIRINEKINLNAKFDLAVGASGTILAIAGMINFIKDGKKGKVLNKFVFTRAELEEVTSEILGRKTPEQRISLKGMEYKRADIIPAGLLILRKSFELFNINEMMISEYALREGVILSMVGKEHTYL
jgi:exopolyphosphatase/guanosine-5'-triphosphate,3'-diphosphate pyrophosphatase